MAKILVVDDSPTIITLVTRLLSQQGHVCATASSGQEGYERAKEEKPSLILMDVVMGDQNGFQTCRKLKRDPQTANIPVVLVTSKAGESDEYWGRMNGASGYLRKPFTPAALLETVEEHI